MFRQFAQFTANATTYREEVQSISPCALAMWIVQHGFQTAVPLRRLTDAEANHVVGQTTRQQSIKLFEATNIVATPTSFQWRNVTDQRAAGVDSPSEETSPPPLRCSTPSMGVILWGESPLCLVPVLLRES
jgi:hypothetical protein